MGTFKIPKIENLTQQFLRLKVAGMWRRKAINILGGIFGTGFTPYSHIVDILISDLTHNLHTRMEHTEETWHKHLATRAHVSYFQ